MSNRVEGGSSPHKESLYKNHYAITEKHKEKVLKKKCEQLNKIAKKRKYEYSYKIQERNCKSGKCRCVVKTK